MKTPDTKRPCRRPLLSVVLLAMGLSATHLAAADPKSGLTLYQRECIDCHAMNGAPISSVARSMKSKGVIMRDLAAKDVQALSDAEWKKAIVEGSGKMKAVTGLVATEVDNILAYMRTIAKKK